MENRKFARMCSSCGKGMNEGYVVNGDLEYYCTDECLYAHYDSEDYEEMFDDGNGDSCYTTWEDESDYEYILINNELKPIEDYESKK